MKFIAAFNTDELQLDIVGTYYRYKIRRMCESLCSDL